MIVINKDVNASSAAYRQYGDSILLVTSIFSTVQGEGPYVGRACVFLRLAGCNIGAKVDCPWCDTAFHVERGTPMVVDAVMMDVREKLNGAGLVVVTGGEPLLQWPALKKLMSCATDIVWQFRTNGLLLKSDTINDALMHDAPIYFVVSPKVPASHGMYRDIPIDWHRMTRALALKYVVEANPGSHYFLPGPNKATETMCALPVYVSGMAVYRRPVAPGEVASAWDHTLLDAVETLRNYRHAVRVVQANPNIYTLSLQTHLFAGVE